MRKSANYHDLYGQLITKTSDRKINYSTKAIEVADILGLLITPGLTM